MADGGTPPRGKNMAVAASKEMNAYFRQLQDEADRCYEVARKARARGMDPELDVEIRQAEDLASRVELLLEFEGIADIIREAAKKHANREEMSIVVAKKVAKEYRGPKHEALDKAVRVGLAVLTEGILVAPLDGIAEVKTTKMETITMQLFLLPAPLGLPEALARQ